MAFYIRKAFKTGPVRLNVSKGGLGLSSGITGARVKMAVVFMGMLFMSPGTYSLDRKFFR